LGWGHRPFTGIFRLAIGSGTPDVLPWNDHDHTP
jgi:hypothetical protein